MSTRLYFISVGLRQIYRNYHGQSNELIRVFKPLPTFTPQTKKTAIASHRGF